MELDEIVITKSIVERFYHKFLAHLENDVTIVGGGPSGLVAGYFLAKAGRKVALYERNLSIGGGMWGGGMMFNEIVVQDAALPVLHEFGVRYAAFQEHYYVSDAVETVATLIAKAMQAGLRIFNCMSVEDVVMRPDRVAGLVLNWTAVARTGLHVDPLCVRSRFVIDATGHGAEVVKVVQEKVPGKLYTPSGRMEGEKALWAEQGEALTLQNTKEVFPGLYVVGMAANATFGGPRMGPVFGGMLLSGELAAREVLKSL